MQADLYRSERDPEVFLIVPLGGATKAVPESLDLGPLSLVRIDVPIADWMLGGAELRSVEQRLERDGYVVLPRAASATA